MTDNIGVRLGHRIAMERKRQHMSITDLSAMSGVGRNIIRNLETGVKGCHLDSAVRLAAALGISLDGLSGPCERCGDSPATGWTCNACGASGEET